MSPTTIVLLLVPAVIAFIGIKSDNTPHGGQRSLFGINWKGWVLIGLTVLGLGAGLFNAANDSRKEKDATAAKQKDNEKLQDTLDYLKDSNKSLRSDMDELVGAVHKSPGTASPAVQNAIKKVEDAAESGQKMLASVSGPGVPRPAITGKAKLSAWAPDENLGLYNPRTVDSDLKSYLRVQPPKTTGNAQRLDPDSLYVSAHWDFRGTPASYLRNHSVTVLNLRTGKQQTAKPVDTTPFGLIDISPRLMEELDAKDGDSLEIRF